MDPLSIYWNSVWQDAQRSHQDDQPSPAHAGQRSARTRSLPRTIAHYGMVAVIVMPFAVFALALILGTR